VVCGVGVDGINTVLRVTKIEWWRGAKYVNMDGRYSTWWCMSPDGVRRGKRKFVKVVVTKEGKVSRRYERSAWRRKGRNQREGGMRERK